MQLRKEGRKERVEERDGRFRNGEMALRIVRKTPFCERVGWGTLADKKKDADTEKCESVALPDSQADR